jgi:hypothetical protein
VPATVPPVDGSEFKAGWTVMLSVAVSVQVVVPEPQSVRAPEAANDPEKVVFCALAATPQRTSSNNGVGYAKLHSRCNLALSGIRIV